ncbi:glycosyltransferase family 4 protein [Streptomyces sp. NPDC057249]|uniref:glycosyltransferase family 4 protein n=1 Tax=Streptomyces sp. NPDC057249 TaxID=3346067 RepID=UPI0036372364
MSSAGPAGPGVAVVVRYFTVGGLERVVTSLANELVGRGLPVRVIVLYAGKRNALLTELDERVDVVALSGSTTARLRALRTLTEGRVVHVNFGDGRIHPLVRAALRDRPTVVTCHSVYSHKRTALINRADRFWSRSVHTVVAVSEAVRRFCVDEVGMDPAKVVVVPNGVEIERIGRLTATHDGPAEPEELSVVSLASLYPHKNHATLLDGFATAHERWSGLRLRMIGDGPELIGLHRAARTLGIADAVDWYGAVWRRDQVVPLVAAGQVFVSASRFEGMPISVLEAMACGLPLVLSDIAPHREVAGDAAVYFPADDPAALAARLGDLAGDPARREALAARAKERAADYDVTLQATRYAEIFDRTARGA